MEEKPILLVEDDLTLGDLYVELFARVPLVLDWYVRARKLDGVLILMNDRGTEVALDSTRYRGAFVDGRLSFSELSGLEVTKSLVALGLPVAAFSGSRFFNEEMVSAGAVCTVDKLEIFGAVLDGRFVCPFTANSNKE